MTDLEGLFWRLEEVDPLFRSTMTLIATLEVPTDKRLVAERLDVVSRRIPRLRDRVAAGPLGSAAPKWVPDPDFDLGYHLRQVRVGGTGSATDLLATAEAVSAEPLDRGRPPWQMVFVDGLQGGQEGLVVRLHHSYTDGLGAVRLALELFDLNRAGSGDDRGVEGAPPPPLPPLRRSSLMGQMLDDLASEATRTAGLLSRVVPWAATRVVEAIVGPEEQARGAAELARSLRDQVLEASMPGSPLLGRRSPGMRLGSLDLSLADLRTAAHRAGGTVNDAFLAGALGGLAEYHAKQGSRADFLRVAVPVSTRTDPAGGSMHNQVEAVLIRGPLGLADPVERVKLVHELVSRARAQPLLGLLDDATALGLRLPGVGHILARLARGIDVVASNVPGPPVPLFLCGSRVERMVPVGPRSGSAVNLTLLSYSDVVGVGVNMDPAAVADPEVLVDCLRVAFEELIP